MAKKSTTTKKKGSKPVKSAPKAVKGKKALFSSESIYFILGVLLLFTALYFVLAFVSFFMTGASDQSLLESSHIVGDGAHNDVSNYAGESGARVAYYFINDCFGISSVFIPVFMILASMKLMKAGRVRLWKWFANFAYLMVWFSIAAQFFTPQSVLNELFFLPGGRHGQFVCDFLYRQIGTFGTLIVLFITALSYFIYLSDETIRLIKKSVVGVKRPIDNGVHSAINNIKDKFERKAAAAEAAKGEAAAADSETEADNADVHPRQDEVPADVDDFRAVQEDSVDAQDYVPEEHDNADDEQGETADEAGDNADAGGNTAKQDVEVDYYDPKRDLEYYNYPTTDLLENRDNGNTAYNADEQHDNEESIIGCLRNFGIEIVGIKSTVGPTVTLYELIPAKGVRIAQIKNLENDIKLALHASELRIIAPIPGKGTIGVEVSNKHPEIVLMSSLLNDKKFKEYEAELPVVLGRTIQGDAFMFDLAKLPHLLVAGSTGTGKSVGLNVIITSLLYRKHPAELKFVMVDPKKVEFSLYSVLENHFLAKVPDDNVEPVITENSHVEYTLNSLCKEMDTRYDLLKRARVRNIKEYNAKFCSRVLNPESGHRYMPYIVVVIDEFGDLIMTAGKNIETPIARIAQLARAVGIHMIIATQRPTTNIITGTIKANFPARIAFKVASVTDSRTILDTTGANQLIGRGDLLYLSSGEPVRMQCALVETNEMENITNYIARQQGYTTAFMLPDVPMPDSDIKIISNDGDNDRRDPLFEEAARVVVETGQGSTSLIQRKFSIGYNRAGRIMDQLERAGVVGPQSGSKPRDVLCTTSLELEMKLNNG